jgi:hypothetical protein
MIVGRGWLVFEKNRDLTDRYSELGTYRYLYTSAVIKNKYLPFFDHTVELSFGLLL